MGDPASRASAWSLRAHRFLAVVFTIAAIGSVVLVAVDLIIARPFAGDLFIALLNSLAALALRRLPRSETGRT
ncbi:hypothetical protein [Pseudarthrobacter oxydans]|jgi:hypothetical protein|uniref:hypothetical protein n=1 Tax=Pseudarthrobacter oxydans TaxID=1671 RepID=UPI0037F793AE